MKKLLLLIFIGIVAFVFFKMGDGAINTQHTIQSYYQKIDSEINR